METTTEQMIARIKELSTTCLKDLDKMLSKKQSIKLADLVNNNPSMFAFDPNWHSFEAGRRTGKLTSPASMLTLMEQQITNKLQDKALYSLLKMMGVYNIAVIARENGKWTFQVLSTSGYLFPVTVVKKNAKGEVKKMADAAREALALAMATMQYQSNFIQEQQEKYTPETSALLSKKHQDPLDNLMAEERTKAKVALTALEGAKPHFESLRSTVDELLPKQTGEGALVTIERPTTLGEDTPESIQSFRQHMDAFVQGAVDNFNKRSEYDMAAEMLQNDSFQATGKITVWPTGEDVKTAVERAVEGDPSLFDALPDGNMKELLRDQIAVMAKTITLTVQAMPITEEDKKLGYSWPINFSVGSKLTDVYGCGGVICKVDEPVAGSPLGDDLISKKVSEFPLPAPIKAFESTGVTFPHYIQVSPALKEKLDAFTAKMNEIASGQDTNPPKEEK